MSRGKRKQKDDLDKIAVLLTHNKLQQLRNQEPYRSNFFLIERLKNLEAEQKVRSQLKYLRKLKEQQDEKAYDDIDARSFRSYGSYPPSPISNIRANMTANELHEIMKNEREKIDKTRNSPGNSRNSPTRELMTAKELSTMLRAELPPKPEAVYLSEYHREKYDARGNTKTKKRTRKPSKKRKHKKRKSTRKK